MTDLSQLIQAEDSSKTDHIYLVYFQILSTIEELERLDWIDDDVTVAGGPDARQAILKAEEYVHSQEYGMDIKDFRIRGVKLLAEADI